MLLLSHKLNIKTPGFNNGETIKIDPVKEIKDGGSSNNYNISLPNHLGTHIDSSKHFDDKGKSISEYPIENFIFKNPKIIDISKGESELITVNDLEKYKKIMIETDLLLIRTGFQKYRDIEPVKYSVYNPGMSADAANYIRKFSNIKAIGLDIISLSAVQNRDEGRLAHRNLLENNDFFIIEDMDLKDYTTEYPKIYVIPIFIEGVDSVPCTVFADK